LSAEARLFGFRRAAIVHSEFKSELNLDDSEVQSFFRAEPLHGQALAALRRMIVRGELKPCTRINEKALCERFGISRTPLREALKVLATEGLIDLNLRRGSSVTAPSRRRLREHFEAVALIESHSARTICERGSARDIRQVAKIHERVLRAFERGQTDAYFEANEAFHRGLVLAAGNETLAEIHQRLIIHLHRARFLSLPSTEVNAVFADAHGAIMSAIEARDADAAGREVVAHQMEVAEDVLASLDPAYVVDD
jgi:DNA-binding GntR family transcriptional regulator